MYIDKSTKFISAMGNNFAGNACVACLTQKPGKDTKNLSPK